MKKTITHDLLHEEVDFTPYEGIEVKGWPVKVFSRGDLIVEGGDYVGAAGRGEFLRRERSNTGFPQGKPVNDN